MFNFKKWRSVLLNEIQNEIALFNEISILYGTPVTMLSTLRPRQAQKVINSEKRFLKRYITLCRKFGFDPSSKEDRENYQSDEGAPVWEPNFGQLSLRFAKSCYGFYIKSYDIINKNKTELRAEKHLFKKRKPKLQKNIIRLLIYALEQTRGDLVQLQKIRIYLTGGQLDRDISRCEKNVRKILEEDNKTSQDIEKIEFENPLAIPNSILQLKSNRSENDLNRWRAVWIYDLYRVILSKDDKPIGKRIQKNEKIKMTKAILAWGHKLMN